MTSGIGDAERCNGIVLDTGDPLDYGLLAELRADARIEFIDNAAEQQAGLQRLRPSPPADVTAEPIRWVYYPWRRTVVRVLGPLGFRLLRLDRNRNLITTAELERLARLRIGVVGLSVGHAIAYTLAAQGLCGELRLTDFDELELSNLNRVPATVFDLGVNKAVVCARRIAELDPYLPVTVTPARHHCRDRRRLPGRPRRRHRGMRLPGRESACPRGCKGTTPAGAHGNQ